MNVQLDMNAQQAADDANEASRDSTEANPANGQDAPVSQDDETPRDEDERGRRRARSEYIRHRLSPVPILAKRPARLGIHEHVKPKHVSVRVPGFARETVTPRG